MNESIEIIKQMSRDAYGRMVITQTEDTPFSKGYLYAYGEILTILIEERDKND